ncbi:immunity 53 family protein [Microtetraspora malaysiensis]|uniref:immunity 53 family protein n=1 Tax=Microtetraspora malaysiensis TaxID=161358 RepID=UPI003D8D893C
MTGDPFGFLQRWYSAQCDGEWEHAYGVKIDTLDNPGWSIAVDLVDTDLEGHVFDWRTLDRTEDDWVHINSDGQLFQGACGPLNLAEMVAEFEKFATTTASAGSI